MRAFADLYVTLVRRLGQLGEIFVKHIAGQVSVPLGVHMRVCARSVGAVKRNVAQRPLLGVAGPWTRMLHCFGLRKTEVSP
jgi:hypothetical protein